MLKLFGILIFQIFHSKSNIVVYKISQKFKNKRECTGWFINAKSTDSNLILFFRKKKSAEFPYIYIYIYILIFFFFLLNRSWRQHPTKQQLYGHLTLITKTIQIRRTIHAGHCWRSRNELISDVLLWTPTHGRAKAG